MADLIRAVIPIALIIGVLFLFLRSANKANGSVVDSVEEQTQELRKFISIAKENQDLKRRQVAALEEIAKKR